MERYPRNGVPEGLSRRMQDLYRHYAGEAGSGLRDGLSVFTVGTKWDTLLDETGFLACPGLYAALPTLADTLKSAAETVEMPKGFYAQHIAERRAGLLKTVLLERMPVTLAPGDLLAGEYRSIMLSRCLSRAEAGSENKLVRGKKGLRETAFAFRATGCGCVGIAGGGFLPDDASVLRNGFSGIEAALSTRYDALSNRERKHEKGATIRAMQSSCRTASLLAARYAALCKALAAAEQDGTRRSELVKLADCLERLTTSPARDFLEAVQALWLVRLLSAADECRPGGGASFGRIDQTLLPYWEASIAAGMTRAFGKELVKCLLLRCAGMADAMARALCPTRPQVFTLSGMNAGGQDATNALTYVFLEALYELSPLPGIRLQIRLHPGTPDAMLDNAADVLARHPGLPLQFSFDGAYAPASPDTDATGYASLGGVCNVPDGGGRIGLGCRISLAKAVELALGGGAGLAAYTDPVLGKPYPAGRDAKKAGSPSRFSDFESFYAAFLQALAGVTEKGLALYEQSAALTMLFSPAPAADCFAGNAKPAPAALEGIGFVTAVNALLAVKFLVYDTAFCTMETLVEALRADWEGFEVLRAAARNRAPRFGCDCDEADAFSARVAADFAQLVRAHVSPVTGAPFFPCLSFDASAAETPLAATPDGRKKGEPFRPLDASGDCILAALTGAGRLVRDSGRPAIGGIEFFASLPCTAFRDVERRSTLKYFLHGAMETGAAGLILRVLTDEDGISPCKSN